MQDYVNVRVPQHIHAKLKKQAEAQRISMVSYLGRLVEAMEVPPPHDNTHTPEVRPRGLNTVGELSWDTQPSI